MRRATIYEYDKLAEKLSNFVAAMGFRFMDLCVKAEPVALLSVTPVIEGEPNKLEDCAEIGKTDDYHFMLIPTYDEDMWPIQKALMAAHPEFEQKIETTEVEVPEDNGTTQTRKVAYLLLTMPEVNDDRYDLLKNSVKAIYDNCKAKMEEANVASKRKFSELAAGETPENLKILNDEIDKLNGEWNTQRDKVYQEKMKEIRDAYTRWLGGMARQEVEHLHNEDARGTQAASSMKMPKQTE